MPEGDSLHRVARRLQVLVGERVEAESPNPRGQATGVARAVDGRVLERVEAVGKNVLLHFDGGVVVRSHLRMNGRWRVRRRGDPAWRGSPWLVLRGAEWEATQWNGPVLGLGGDSVRALGPDLLAPATDPAELVMRAAPRRPDATRRRRARRPAGRLRASGTCGWPRRSGTRASRRGRGSRRSRDDGSGADARVGARRDARRGRRATAYACRLSQSRTRLPAVRRADSLPRARRCEPDRVLVSGVPADRRDGEGGIRTLDERITTRNALAGRRLQPLGHLSRVAQDIGRSGRLPKPGSEGAATLCRPTEGCRSGRTGRSRKPLRVQASRGFKSLPLRSHLLGRSRPARRPRGSRRRDRRPGSRGSRRSRATLPRTPRSSRRTMRTATSAQTKRKTASVTAANPVPKVYARSTREA